MQCNGKCHLMKELAKASDDDKPLTSNKKQNSNQLVDILVAEVTSYHFIVFDFTASDNQIIAYTNLYSHLDSHAIFHPPIFLS